MKRHLLLLLACSLLFSGCRTLRRWRAGADASSAERMKQVEKQVEVLTDRIEQMEYQLRFNVASNQVSLGKYEEAIKGFREVIDLDPASRFAADSLYEIAKIYKYKLKNPASAVDIYEELLRRYPKNEFRRTAAFEIAESLSELGKNSEARAQYRQIISKSDNDKVAEKAYFEIADLYESERNFEEARKAYQSLIEKFTAGSFRSAALYRLANCSLALADTPAALRQFEKVYTEFPSGDFAELAYLGRANAQVAENADSAARGDISKYMILYPNGRYRAELERLLTKIDRKKSSAP